MPFVSHGWEGAGPLRTEGEDGVSVGGRGVGGSWQLMSSEPTFGMLFVVPSDSTNTEPAGVWMKSVRRVSLKLPPAFCVQLKLRVISEVFWLLGLKGAKSAVRLPWETLPSLPVGAAGERTGRTPTKFCSSAHNPVDL